MRLILINHSNEMLDYTQKQKFSFVYHVPVSNSIDDNYAKISSIVKKENSQGHEVCMYVNASAGYVISLMGKILRDELPVFMVTPVLDNSNKIQWKVIDIDKDSIALDIEKYLMDNNKENKNNCISQIIKEYKKLIRVTNDDYKLFELEQKYIENVKDIINKIKAEDTINLTRLAIEFLNRKIELTVTRPANEQVRLSTHINTVFVGLMGLFKNNEIPVLISFADCIRKIRVCSDKDASTKLVFIKECLENADYLPDELIGDRDMEQIMQIIKNYPITCTILYHNKKIRWSYEKDTGKFTTLLMDAVKRAVYRFGLDDRKYLRELQYSENYTISPEI